MSRLLASLFTMSLLSLLGCSRPATDLPASLSDLRVELSIEDVTERNDERRPYSRQAITAVLRDAKGRVIEREDARIEVNGVPMQFQVSTGNYYGRHPYYQLRDDPRLPVKPATDYHCVLVLPDGARHEIGTLRMPALELSQFEFPSRLPADGNVRLRWRDLAEPASLVLFRSDVVREGDGTEVHEAGSSNDPAALRRNIGPGWFRKGSAELQVPVDFLASNQTRRLAALGAEILVVHEGKVAKTFAKQSTLRAERRVTLRMECPEPKATGVAKR